MHRDVFLMWDQTFRKYKNRMPVRQPPSLLGPLLRATAGLGEGEEEAGGN